MTTSVWTDDRVAMLKNLVVDGWSASQIAGELGGALSRNAVISKINRMGLTGPRTGKRGPAISRGRSAKVVQPSSRKAVVSQLFVERLVEEQRAVPETPPPQVVETSKFACDMMQLNGKTCRYPLGDPRDPEFKFCGAQKVTGLPYCREHSLLCFRSENV